MQFSFLCYSYSVFSKWYNCIAEYDWHSLATDINWNSCTAGSVRTKKVKFLYLDHIYSFSFWQESKVRKTFLESMLRSSKQKKKTPTIFFYFSVFTRHRHPSLLVFYSFCKEIFRFKDVRHMFRFCFNLVKQYIKNISLESKIILWFSFCDSHLISHCYLPSFSHTNLLIQST